MRSLAHNSNTKVIVKAPVPEVKKGDAFEDTMLLIEMMKHKKELNNYEKKVRGSDNFLCLL